MSQSFSPISTNERLGHLDELRGLALLGILLVNFYSLGFPLERGQVGAVHPEGFLDMLAVFVVDFLARNKFYTLFSFLFGVGLAMQFDRSSQHGKFFFFYGFRRMAALFFFGWAHIVFLWAGDILVIYSVLGFALLLLLHLPARVLVFLVVLALVFYLMVLSLLLLPSALSRLDPELAKNVYALENNLYEDNREQYETSVTLLLEGNLAENALHRIGQAGEMFGSLIITGWLLSACFFLGAAVWKAGILQRPWNHRRPLKTAFFAGLIIGVPTNFIFALTEQISPPWQLDLWTYLGYLCALAGQLSFLACMVAFFSLRWCRAPIVGPLAVVGRMALTNYLLQSLIFCFIFNGWGLGLLERVAPFPGLFLCLFVYGLQIIGSRLWLRHFKQGPMEALWRFMTYRLTLSA
ncbi:MAG: DUF418 domain-containing protein [Acidobacteriota bacterium]|nr:DUF418 domain-containing protein [Acidobacteriota bacterium]